MIDYIPILPFGMIDAGYKIGFTDGFILPQYWENDTYREFFTQNEFDTIIIDNDVYEKGECTPISTLCEIADELDAERIFIVGHETLSSPYKTLFGFIDELKSSSHCYESMIVMDGTPDDIATMYNTLRDTRKVAFSLPVSLTRKGYDRAAIYKLLHPRKEHYFHALGLDNLMELLHLSNSGIRSVDSSIVATAAVNNYNIKKHYKIDRTSVTQIPRVDLTSPGFPTREVLDTMSNLHFVQSIIDMED